MNSRPDKKRIAWQWTAAALLLLAAGAPAPAAAAGPSRERVSARFTLPDRSTDVDPGRIAILLVAANTEQASATAAAIAGNVRVFDARGAKVAAEIATRLERPGPDGEVQATVSIHPQDSRRGWYEARVKVPDEATFFPDAAVRADGSAVLRYRIGSEPRALQAMVCQKEDGWRTVRIELSEPVTAGREKADTFDNLAAAALGDGADCISALRRAGLSDTFTEPRPQLDLACAPAKTAVAGPTTLALTLSGRLRSPAGVPLANAGTLHLSLPSQEELRTAGGCVRLALD